LWRSSPSTLHARCCYGIWHNLPLLPPLQDILTHSVLICKVSPELLDSLVTDMEMIQMNPALQFSSAMYEHVSFCSFLCKTHCSALLVSISGTHSFSVLEKFSIVTWKR
jgi:hypothetical protein